MHAQHCLHVPVGVHLCVCVCVCVLGVDIYVYTHACAALPPCARRGTPERGGRAQHDIYACVHIHTNIHVHTHTYIHTNKQTYIHRHLSEAGERSLKERLSLSVLALLAEHCRQIHHSRRTVWFGLQKGAPPRHGRGGVVDELVEVGKVSQPICMIYISIDTRPRWCC